MIKPITLIVFHLLCLFMLAACGGGGGGSTNGGNQGGSQQQGAFTLARNEANFELTSWGAANQTIALTLTGSGTTYVGAAFTDGQSQPSWLTVDITGSGSSYSVVITADAFGLAEGSHSANFSVGTADGEGNVLQSKVITVNLTVLAAISFSETSQSASFVYGSDQTSLPITHSFTAGSSTSWTAGSNQPWLSVSNPSGSGSGNIHATIDATDLAPGSYSAELTLTDDERPQNRSTVSYSVEVTEPELTLEQAELVLGGTDGVEALETQLSFNLNTGTQTYPWSIAVTEHEGSGWLSLGTESGDIGGEPESIRIAGPELIQSGTYTATLDFSVTVKEQTLTREIPVTLHKEANRIIVSSAGVAFTSAPTRSVLNRTVKVLSSIDRDDTPWTATASQNWISVTPSGETGDNLEISVSAEGLAPGEIYFGEISVTSSDERVENEESIRVGLTVLAEDPQEIITVELPVSSDFITASPVEPLVFTKVDNDIRAYNVFTGIVERTFTDLAGGPGGMTMSDDGRSLFIYNHTDTEVVEVDSVTGVVRHRYPTTGGNIDYMQPAYMRPNGIPLLVGAGPHIYNVETFEEITPSNEFATIPGGLSLSVASSNPAWVVGTNGELYEFYYSALNGGELSVEQIFSAGTAQGRDGQACVSADGTQVYTASGAPYNFPGTGIESGQQEQVLDGTNYPNSILCGWNGVIIGGAESYYNEIDIFIYNGNTGQSLGNLSSSTQTSYRSLIHRGLALSGDAARLVSISEVYDDYNQLRFYTIPPQITQTVFVDVLDSEWRFGAYDTDNGNYLKAKTITT